MLTVRGMTEADVARVSALRIAGWRAAYTGIVPQGYLDAMDAVEDAAQRRKWFSASAGRVVNLVAEDSGRGPDGAGRPAVAAPDPSAPGHPLVGWASFGPYRGEDDGTPTGELYALYVRPDRIGTGVGRALTAQVVRHCAALGRTRLALWVLTDNARARRFYASAGFAPDGAATTDLYDGVPVEEVRYVRALAPPQRP